MQIFNRIHIFGASGAGVSTLGREIARRWGHEFLDTDDFYWEKTDPPFVRPVERNARIEHTMQALSVRSRWVLAGSLCSWGDSFMPLFELAIFVVTDTTIRLQRLRSRERERFGSRVLSGGDMFESHEAFIAWAAGYDNGPVHLRSRTMHEQWIPRLGCPVVRVDGAAPSVEICDRLLAG